MSVVEFNPETISLTPAALQKIQQLKAAENNSELKLRVFVEGGGCAGFQYGFTFDELMAEDDASFQQDDVITLVDSLSYQYLIGSQVDYLEGLEGSRFVINNPNAETTCGCGASFSA